MSSASSDQQYTPSSSDSKAVVGVLAKYGGIRQGWRARFFVLHEGILQYYKIPPKTATEDIVNALQFGRIVKTIGSNSAPPGRRIRTRQRCCSQPHTKPEGEVAIQIASVRNQSHGATKFDVHTGVTTLALRARTREDCQAWIEALQEAKCEGVPSDVVEYVVDAFVLQEQHHATVASAAEKRSQQLMACVARLLEEKRAQELAVQIDATAGSPLLHSCPEAATLQVPHDMAHWQQLRELPKQAPAATDSSEVFFDATPHGAAEAEGDSVVFRTTIGLSADAASEQEAPLEPAWLCSYPAPPPRRVALPAPAQKETPVSLWELVKELIGKDLTRVCLPVYFNEPLSALQKLCEQFEYSELLDTAAACPAGSMRRHVLVAAFAVSGYSSSDGRLRKPFNPLLGETFEMLYPEKGWRFISEKVSHHPTVFALHAEGRGWVVAEDGEVRSKFWGRSLELKPLGTLQLTFHDGEVFTWNKAMKLRFRDSGMFRSGRHEVNGHLKGPPGDARLLDRAGPVPAAGSTSGDADVGMTLYGSWSTGLWLEAGNGPAQELWRKNPPAQSPSRYGFSAFCMALNELPPSIQHVIAPTDSRLRPDQRLTELGRYERANKEKHRLEKKQRAARKAAERGEPLQPRWFEVVTDAVLGRELKFRYRGGYWESRAVGVFEDCREIFGE